MSKNLPSTVTEINKLHSEIMGAATKSLKSAIKIGMLLHGAKGELDHGDWSAWVKNNVEFSDRTAQRYMSLYSNRSKIKTDSVTDLGEAYSMLTEPKTAPIAPPSPANKPEAIKAPPLKQNAPAAAEKPAKTAPAAKLKDFQKEATQSVLRELEKVVDSTGLIIPKSLIPLWERSYEVQELLSYLSKVRSVLKDAESDKDALYRSVNFNSVKSSINQAYEDVKSAKPFAVCPSCQGKLSEQCTACKKTGLVSEFFWKTCVTQEDKDMRDVIVKGQK
jgi:hypothetical protein